MIPNTYHAWYRRGAVPFTALVLALAAPCRAACAQSWATLEGAWRLDPGASDTVARAIDHTVQPMNVVVRLVARRRLTALNPAFPAVRLAQRSGDTLGITWGAGVEARAVPGSPPAPYTSAEGERMSVRLGRAIPPQPWLLEETYVTKDGTRVNRWGLRADGSLEVLVTVTGSRLPRELAYRLVYRRSGAAS